MGYSIAFIGADNAAKATLANALGDKFPNSLAILNFTDRDAINNGYELGKGANQETYLKFLEICKTKLIDRKERKDILVAEQTLLDPLCYLSMSSNWKNKITQKPLKSTMILRKADN